MNVVNLFPIEVFEFTNTKIDNANIIEKLNNLSGPVKHGSVISYLNPIHKLEEFKDLFLWFDQCLNEIKIKLQYDCDRFQITNSWFNKSLASRGMHQNYHKHVMSFFSAVYYLTPGSPTIFEDPVNQRVQGQIEVLRNNYLPFEHFEAEPGKLIIFPSWMYHQTRPHMFDFDRYVISFNSLPTGKINSAAGGDSQCYISIEDPND
jgi:uncharacterized protein (TIGR02466 family)